jgi:hypothetical protein
VEGNEDDEFKRRRVKTMKEKQAKLKPKVPQQGKRQHLMEDSHVVCCTWNII